MNATATPYQPRYSFNPRPLSVEERLGQLAEQFPGVVIWWGRATREWWALIGDQGYEAQTLDDLLVKVRAALAEFQFRAPAASVPQRPQTSAAGPAPRPQPPRSTYRPAEPPRFPPRYADQFTNRRPSRGRRLLEGVRRFLIAEEPEVW
ncbi:hypothetical protein [Actinomadura harenae]|uniref:Uncharacterized protein n=1 Tax=Actinomadura harenae TaxID=2483351 RepID=A0A3M2LQV1_9ACTN|nr:hypothetical protein [Actinomadura harenae]RMI39861.1 hypothetical protein EBO15_28240 [Actinomadura harenae]